MDFHGQIMNIRMLDDISIASVVTDGGNIEPSAVHCYKTGHRDARHAAAKVAAEADQRIAELEAQLAAANARIKVLEFEQRDRFFEDLANNMPDEFGG